MVSSSSPLLQAGERCAPAWEADLEFGVVRHPRLGSSWSSGCLVSCSEKKTDRAAQHSTLFSNCVFLCSPVCVCVCCEQLSVPQSTAESSEQPLSGSGASPNMEHQVLLYTGGCGACRENGTEDDGWCVCAAPACLCGCKPTGCTLDERQCGSVPGRDVCPLLSPCDLDSLSLTLSFVLYCWPLDDSSLI